MSADDVGRCGNQSPDIYFPVGGQTSTSICALPAGHAGWHRGDDNSEWTRGSADDVGADDAALRAWVERVIGDKAFGATIPHLRSATHNGAYDVVLVADLRATLAALPRPVTQPEGTTVTEWGVRWTGGDITSCGWMNGVSESFARGAMKPNPMRVAPSRVPDAIVSRQRTSYPDHLTDWEPTDA